MITNLNNCGAKYGMVWLDIEGTQYWTTSTSTNQNFFQGLVSELKTLGKTIGVYTSQSQWSPIMGSSYTGGSSYPLWYAHYESPPQPNFNDFVAFGGWTKPAMKQFQGTTTTCSASVDLSWYPN